MIISELGPFLFCSFYCCIYQIQTASPLLQTQKCFSCEFNSLLECTWHPAEPNWPRKARKGSEATSVIQQFAPSNLPGIMHSTRGQWKHNFPKDDLSQCVIHSCQPSEWISYAQVWILALTSVALYIYQQKDPSLLPLSCIYLKWMLVHVKMIYKLSAKWKPDWCI